jgi:cellulose synthase/poly-beta-1,6-N-acetylglucosamine synthase-like glycosyltransferase
MFQPAAAFTPLDGWIEIYAAAQILYLTSFVVIAYFLSRPVNWVKDEVATTKPPEQLPLFVMAYPVLHEDYATMHSTLVTLGRMDYPKSRYRVIAIPNSDDTQSIDDLRRLKNEFSFLEIVEIPPTTDPRWNVVWKAWRANPKAYWFRDGTTAGVRDLPPKKTRQLIFLLYTLIEEIGTDWVLDYLDADSMPPADHFHSGAIGLEHYDVVQATNVSGNLLDSMAASLHSFDHMCWDGKVYPHMSANGSHPYYVLGKGQFYKASDLYELGGFNPWIAIEDPEVGMRLWTNGRKLGVVAAPLIEEVPRTFYRGIVQRNRWVCGFFQSLGAPLKQMGMPFWRRMQARLNIIPVLSHAINVIGLPTGIYALYLFLSGISVFPLWIVLLSAANIAFYILTMGIFYANAWKRTKLVLNKWYSRVWYMLRINPIVMFLYHVMWVVPLTIGFAMFLTDRGKVWIRTQKYDADHRFADAAPQWAQAGPHDAGADISHARDNATTRGGA